MKLLKYKWKESSNQLQESSKLFKQENCNHKTIEIQNKLQKCRINNRDRCLKEFLRQISGRENI